MTYILYVDQVDAFQLLVAEYIYNQQRRVLIIINVKVKGYDQEADPYS